MMRLRLEYSICLQWQLFGCPSDENRSWKFDVPPYSLSENSKKLCLKSLFLKEQSIYDTVQLTVRQGYKKYLQKTKTIKLLYFSLDFEFSDSLPLLVLYSVIYRKLSKIVPSYCFIITKRKEWKESVEF